MATQIDQLGTTLTLNARGSTVSVGTTNAISIVGGYDKSQAADSVVAGEAIGVNGGTQAARLFGEGSELHRAVAAATANPVGTVYAVPLPEVETTETVTGVSSGTLNNAPVFTEAFNPEHTITVTDTQSATSMTVEISYATPLEAPTESDTIVINPETGDFIADASSDYDINYTYGEYSEAVASAVSQPVRYASILTSNTGMGNLLLSEITEEVRNGSFMRGIMGASPSIEVGAVSDYAPTVTSNRIIQIAPSHAMNRLGHVRTAAAVSGLLAAQPVDADGSITYDDVNGLTELGTKYRPTEAEQFSQVTALDRTQTVVGGQTTANESQFRDIYAVEIMDFVADAALDIANDFKGGGLFDDRIRLLRNAIERVLTSFANQRPPLLADPESDNPQPFDVTIQQGASESTLPVVISIDPAPIMEEINITLNVGEISSFEGAA